MKQACKVTMAVALGILGSVVVYMVQAAETPIRWQSNNSRLFTNPAERSKLDAMRQTASALALQAQETQKEPEAEAAVLLPAEISMQGYVKRSDGKKSTVWINHQAQQENTETSDVQIGTLSTKAKSKNKLDNADEVHMKLPSNGQQFKLKAGQSYLPEENRVMDLNARPGNQ
jgi:hypothetical protein